MKNPRLWPASRLRRRLQDLGHKDVSETLNSKPKGGSGLTHLGLLEEGRGPKRRLRGSLLFWRFGVEVQKPKPPLSNGCLNLNDLRGQGSSFRGPFCVGKVSGQGSFLRGQGKRLNFVCFLMLWQSLGG